MYGNIGWFVFRYNSCGYNPLFSLYLFSSAHFTNACRRNYSAENKLRKHQHKKIYNRLARRNGNHIYFYQHTYVHPFLGKNRCCKAFKMNYKRPRNRLCSVVFFVLNKLRFCGVWTTIIHFSLFTLHLNSHTFRCGC